MTARVPPRVMYVTDSSTCPLPVPVVALAAVEGGVDCVQLRESSWSDARVVLEASALVAACRPHGARVLVNDRFDLALAAGAGGVHLKSGGLVPSEVREAARRAGAGASFLVGVAAHAAEDVVAACDAGADYVTMGPLHATPGKVALGEDGVRRALDLARRARPGRLPAWLALGGVRSGDAARLSALAGPDEAWGVAAVRVFQEAAQGGVAAVRSAARSLVDAVSEAALAGRDRIAP